MAEARALFRGFNRASIQTVLTHGDLLSSSAGQRQQGVLLSIARVMWPRWLIRRLFPKLGLFMLITTVKSERDKSAHRRETTVAHIATHHGQ